MKDKINVHAILLTLLSTLMGTGPGQEIPDEIIPNGSDVAVSIVDGQYKVRCRSVNNIYDVIVPINSTIEDVITKICAINPPQPHRYRELQLGLDLIMQSKAINELSDTLEQWFIMHETDTLNTLKDQSSNLLKEIRTTVLDRSIMPDSIFNPFVERGMLVSFIDKIANFHKKKIELKDIQIKKNFNMDKYLITITIPGEDRINLTMTLVLPVISDHEYEITWTLDTSGWKLVDTGTSLSLRNGKEQATIIAYPNNEENRMHCSATVPLFRSRPTFPPEVLKRMLSNQKSIWSEVLEIWRNISTCQRRQRVVTNMGRSSLINTQSPGEPYTGHPNRRNAFMLL